MLAYTLTQLIPVIFATVSGAIYFFCARKFDPRLRSLERPKRISKEGDKKNALLFFVTFFLLMGSGHIINQLQLNPNLHYVFGIVWLIALVIFAKRSRKNSFERNNFTLEEQAEIKRKYSKLNLYFLGFYIILFCLLLILFNTNNPIIDMIR